ASPPFALHPIHLVPGRTLFCPEYLIGPHQSFFPEHIDQARPPKSKELAMTITARRYRDLNDLKEMQAVLSAGRQAANQAYYVHPGDLSWWLFYTDENYRDKICLWEWNSRLAGWSLLSSSSRSFDVFVVPEMHGRSFEAKVMLWAEEIQSSALKKIQSKDIRTMWVAETDRTRIHWLEMRGFQPNQKVMYLMQRSLDTDLPGIELPQGFKVRSVAGEKEVKLRAAASHAAFGSEKSFEDYWPRMLRFMQSPVYRPENDLVIVSPDGDFASFCILWLDPVTRIGLFEPVGTHPTFQGRGLGRAVLSAGLQRLHKLGMTQANVCVESNNLSAIHLYESLGFTKTSKLLTYEKPLLQEKWSYQ
ncbi:MAG: GNAT family N-acetyltransferase, partial [Chloroflexota bacterium]